MSDTNASSRSSRNRFLVIVVLLLIPITIIVVAILAVMTRTSGKTSDGAKTITSLAILDAERETQIAKTLTSDALVMGATDTLLAETQASATAQFHATETQNAVATQSMQRTQTATIEFGTIVALTGTPTAEPCFVQASDSNVEIRVGPGFNRAIRSYLTPNTAIEVVGQYADSDGNVWWKILPPGYNPAEVDRYWISADSSLTESGDCNNVPLATSSSHIIVLASQSPGQSTSTPAPGETSLPQASISFAADQYSIAQGECATIHWEVEGVNQVYYQGKGVVAHGSSMECPRQTTTYELWVVLLDGTTTYRYVTITVGQGTPAPTPLLQPTPVAAAATATPTGTPAPSPTHSRALTSTPRPGPTQVAEVPLRVRDVSGGEIGDGTLRLFAPEQVEYPQTVRIELELHLDNRYITPTPRGPVGVTPIARTTTTPRPNQPTPTPRTFRFEETGQSVYERMGATLSCLSSSFEGCDDDTNVEPSRSRNFRQIGLDGATWTWSVKPRDGITGLQDLTVELWTLQLVEEVEVRHVEWDYAFQIEVVGQPGVAAAKQDGNTNGSNTLLFLVVGVIAVGAVISGTWVVLRRRQRGPAPNIFISYRREGGWTAARSVNDRLITMGANVFFDVESINEGYFAQILEKAIINCDYFVVVLAPRTLESEWVRREILTAMQHHKKIIPLLVEGFDISAPLPDEVKDLASHNAIRLEPEFFEAAMQRLASFVNLKVKK